MVNDKILYLPFQPHTCRCTIDNHQVNIQHNQNIKQTSCRITSIDSSNHTELSNLYDTIYDIHCNNNEDAKSCPRKESAQGDTCFGCEYVEIDNSNAVHRVHRANKMMPDSHTYEEGAVRRYLPGNDNHCPNDNIYMEMEGNVR